MPRYIFPAGAVTVTDGRPRALQFFRSATATRPQTDLKRVESGYDTTPIANGIITTGEDGSYPEFAGPDDLTSLWMQVVSGPGGRTKLDSTGQVLFTPTYAPADSPVFTGNPTAPTPSLGDSDASISTTGFVKAAIDAALSPLKSGVYTKDYASLQEALTALEGLGGGILHVADQDHPVSTAATYNADSGPILIRGEGYKSRITATGSTNVALRIYGQPGVTTRHVRVNNIRFHSTTSGASNALLHLEGVAYFDVTGNHFTGGVKAGRGILCTGSQQGVISNNEITADIGIDLIESGAVHSNGIEVHGNTLICNTFNVRTHSIDSGWVHSNHMILAPTSVRVYGTGYGSPVVANNHMELHSTAGVHASTACTIYGNSFFPATSGTDIAVDGGNGVQVFANTINGSVSFTSPADWAMFYANTIYGGTWTDTSTNMQCWGNRNGSPTAGARLVDKLSVTTRDTGGGHIATFNANPAIDAGSGIRVAGAGSGREAYVQLHNVSINGLTSGGVVEFKDQPGGTLWCRVTPTHIRGAAFLASAAAPSTFPGEVSYGATTATTVGVAGAAAALPATPSGYVVINVGGTDKKIPYYNA